MTLVVILAGGAGNRMGGAKPLRLLCDERLIDRAVRLARRWSEDVAIAVRSSDQIPRPCARLILDDPTIEGPVSGLASALREARELQAGQVLTIGCDMPFLPSDLLARLSAGIGGGAAAVAAADGRLHPVCALWKAEALDELTSYLATGRRSLKGFAEWVGFAEVAWTGDQFANVNTPEELAAAELRCRSEG